MLCACIHNIKRTVQVPRVLEMTYTYIYIIIYRPLQRQETGHYNLHSIFFEFLLATWMVYKGEWELSLT